MSSEEVAGLVETYNAKFGLDQPMWRQYLNYLGNMARLDFGVSISNYPATVNSMLARSIPWTIGLLLTATLISFTIGTVIGALLAWGKAPFFLRVIVPAFFTFSAVPFYLMGIVLLYFFAFKIPIFPLFGGFSTSRVPEMSFSFMLDIMHHSILPAMAIVLAQIGFWAMGMRSMMITIQGEDYILQAEAKGLKGSAYFLSIRHAQCHPPPVHRPGSLSGHHHLRRHSGRSCLRLSGRGQHAVAGRTRL